MRSLSEELIRRVDLKLRGELLTQGQPFRELLAAASKYRDGFEVTLTGQDAEGHHNVKITVAWWKAYDQMIESVFEVLAPRQRQDAIDSFVTAVQNPAAAPEKGEKA